MKHRSARGIASLSGPRLMIARDPANPARAHVVGSLTEDAVPILRHVVDSGVAVLDLAEVIQVDDPGVRLLKRLRAERCSFERCPRWLELWLARALAGSNPARFLNPDRLAEDHANITEAINMSARHIIQMIFPLAIALVLPAPQSGAALATWDQASVVALGKELEESADALLQTFHRQPSPNLGSIKSESYFRLKQLVRMLRSEARVLVASLEDGEGREQTAWNYEMLMSLTRSARDEARRVFVTTDLSERAAAVRRVLNQLGPYYDPDFETLAPNPTIEPGPKG